MKWNRKWLITALPAVLLLVLAFNFWMHGDGESAGERVYRTQCARCHGAEGEGFRGLYPPLAEADWVRNDPGAVLCAIRYGIGDSILVNGKWYHQPMMPVEGLSEIEEINLLNYILREMNGMDVRANPAAIREWNSACY